MAISSHHIGLSKPDPRFYRTAHERLAVPPDAVMFFADVADNVASASTLGIRAFQFGGVEGLRERLQREGIL